MASDDAQDLLGKIEKMVKGRRENIIEKEELRQQMAACEGWDDTQFEEAERELLRTGAVVQTIGGEKLQVDRFDI